MDAHAYIERKMAKRGYARNVARDLWMWINQSLRATGELRPADGDLLAFRVRCLVYLSEHYNTEALTDTYQGRS